MQFGLVPEKRTTDVFLVCEECKRNMGKKIKNCTRILWISKGL